MPIILRLDVDKPFGNASYFKRIISKLREDYYFPPVRKMGYIKHALDFAKILNENSISAILYFRNCTAPNPSEVDILKELGQSIGFHAENTRSFENFVEELTLFKKITGLTEIHSFTKHGSGFLKLGRNHYPPYEESSYLEWSTKTGIPFYFGNGEANKAEDLKSLSFYSKMFWIEKNYRNDNEMTIEKAVEIASTETIPILTHPENYFSIKEVHDDFTELVLLSAKAKIDWVIPNN